jgi:CBS domain-containing protein
MKIRDVMTPNIDVVAPEDTLTTAAQLMADLDLEALPVSDNNRLAGVITGRDIATRVVADGCDPKQVTVAMTFADALALFRRLGVNVETMSQRDFSISYFALAKRYHPDRNPKDADLMANINAARAAILNSYQISQLTVNRRRASDVTSRLEPAGRIPPTCRHSKTRRRARGCGNHQH